MAHPSSVPSRGAARIADGVYLDGYWLKSQVRECIEKYDQALAASGNRGERDPRRELLFGESRQKAIDAGRGPWVETLDTLHGLDLPGPLEWVANELRSGGYSHELPFIAGAPEECAEELVEYARQGVETIVIRMQSARLGTMERHSSPSSDSERECCPWSVRRGHAETTPRINRRV